MDRALFDLLRSCTVLLEAPRRLGTGFFVAPGLILTCAHVVESARHDAAGIKVHCDGESYRVRRIAEFLDTFHYPDLKTSYPDLALLQTDFVEHPCVYLDPAVNYSDELVAQAAYTSDYPGGESTTVEYEGPAFIVSTRNISARSSHWFLKFKRGQIVHGY
jgi:hypothetical protein